LALFLRCFYPFLESLRFLFHEKNLFVFTPSFSPSLANLEEFSGFFLSENSGIKANEETHLFVNGFISRYCGQTVRPSLNKSPSSSRLRHVRGLVRFFTVILDKPLS